MTGQHRKFVQMMATVVKSLGNISTVYEHIVDLGRRHASYDVSEKYYAIVAQALLTTLRRFFGPGYTRELHDSWGAAYNMLARVMFESVGAAHSPGHFFGSVVWGVITPRYGVAEAPPDQQERLSQSRPSPIPRKNFY